MEQYIDSKYMKMFKSCDLNRVKYNEFYEKAVMFREFRNSLSRFVWPNILYYVNMGSNNFLKFIRASFPNKLHSNFDYDQITQVYTDYSNRMDRFIQNIVFTTHTFVRIDKYKKATKVNKAGDFKCCVFKEESNALTKCLSYLGRYGNTGTLDFIKRELAENAKLKEDKKKFYENIIRLCDKFTFERLLSLALAHRKRLLDEFLKREPITYTSLTFGARSRKNKFIVYNDNFNSCIKTFITLSWDNTDKEIVVPVKYSKKYHGEMSLYNDVHKNNFQYEVSLDEKKREVYIRTAIDGKREVFDATECTDYIGGDVNIKHNMLCLSDEIFFNGIATREVDYDRNIINEFSKLMNKIEKNKKENPDYHEGRRIRIKRDELKKDMKMSIREKLASVVEAIKTAGKNHLVLENLTGISSRCYTTDDNDVNLAEIIKFVGLSSIKDEFRHIAHKHGVAVSLVHPSYTSQMCPHCGHIHKNNRKTQESFVCEECGYTANADMNSS